MNRFNQFLLTDSTKEFFGQICYNYDRGLDFDKAPKGLVDKIIAQLETLPKIFEPSEAEINRMLNQMLHKKRYNF